MLICENVDSVDFLVKRGMRFDNALEYINRERGPTVSNINEKEWRQGYFGVKHTLPRTF